MQKNNKLKSVMFWMGYFLLIPGVALTLVPGIVSAQEEEFILEDTVVTATKTGETLAQETPLTISVFDDEMIRSTTSFRLDDLAAFSPNVEIRDNFYYIRGIGNQAEWATVEVPIAVYVDGVFLPRGLGSQTDLFDVERVEILRGPQGTVYGQNSTGGAINIITKRPTDMAEGAAAVEVGSDSKLRFDGTISGPIVENRVNGRLTVKAQTSEGYTDIVRGPSDEDTDAFNVRGALDFRFSDTTSLLLRADVHDEEAKGRVSRFIDPTGSYQEAIGFVLPSGFHDMTRDVEESFKIEHWGLSADLSIELPFGTLTSLTAYRSYVGEDLSDNDHTDFNVFSGFEKEDNEWFSEEIQLNGSTDRFNWVAGGYYYWHNELYDVWMMFPDFYGDWSLLMDGDYTASTLAFFANVDYMLTDRLRLEVGARYTYSDREMDWNDNYSGLGHLVEEGDWDKFTPKFVLEYQKTDDLMFYGTIGQGFRAGTLDPVNPQAGLPSNVNEETVWNYEIGMKSDWLNKRLRVNANVFYMDYDDMVMDYFTVVNDIIQNIVQNAAKAEMSGFELEMLARPVEPLTLNLNVGYLDTEMVDNRNARDPDTGEPLDASGNLLPFVPEWSYSFGAQYVFEVGDAGFLTLRGDVQYRGEQFSEVSNDPIYELDSLTLLNAFLRYETADGRWSLDVYGKNLADEEYYFNKGAGTFGGVLGSVGAPVRYGARVTFKY